MGATTVRWLVLAVVIAVSGTASVHYAGRERDETAVAAVVATSGASRDGGGNRFERLTDPPRTVVTTSTGAVVATLTDGSRTVVLTGPARTFGEPKHTRATVTSTAWVRLAPRPWMAGAEREDWFDPWLTGAAGDTTPDVLAVAMQYVDGAPPVRNGAGLRVAGDAAFAEDADVDRYLGVEKGPLDSAGLVRMVFGYRTGYPLRGDDGAGGGLPRSATAMAETGPGTRVGPDTRDYSRLQPGDLLFFTATSARVSQVGIYLGIDDEGHRRVLASRKSADGPTFGDDGGASTLDGTGGYARTFRTAKRL
ncbi:NlpC/P60 family protein [Umezawaea sp. NPDC059074]|uniref:NlpC/P60 family protein n=1 Tax=Umezawaea sp. NPDC059074 TaxID=3346716 RepID=UPI0036CEEA24